MAVVLHVGADDWRLVRFAVSPLHATTGALRLVRRVLDGQLVPTRPWELFAVRRAAQLPLGPLLALLPGGSWNPDVLNPPPRGPRADFADELSQVAAVDPDTFAGELARCLAGQGHAVPQASPAAQREEVVGLLELAWRELLLPQWSRLQDVLSADVAVRGTALAAGGLAAVLADLHPQGAAVRRQHPGRHHPHRRRGTRRPRPDPAAHSLGRWVGAMWDPPWQPALIYPARGTSAKPVDLASAGLGRLLGGTRAALFAALTDPATTSGLADRCQVPLSTASDHLAGSARPALPPPTASVTRCSTNGPTSATRSSTPRPARDPGPERTCPAVARANS